LQDGVDYTFPAALFVQYPALATLGNLLHPAYGDSDGDASSHDAGSGLDDQERDGPDFLGSGFSSALPGERGKDLFGHVGYSDSNFDLQSLRLTLVTTVVLGPAFHYQSLHAQMWLACHILQNRRSSLFSVVTMPWVSSLQKP
jgi:hypothetical protein